MNHAHEMLVYLAFKDIFTGPDAHLLSLKTLRKRVRKHDCKDEVQALMKQHKLDHICNTAKTLLENGVFESTHKAKIQFPEVFDVSPSQTAAREASEAKAARCEAHAMRKSIEEQAADLKPPTTSEKPLGGLNTGIGLEAKPPAVYERPTPSVPSLYPIYFPLRTQHRLLKLVQDVLESSCYRFARRLLNDLLQEKGWDSAECIELNIWASVLRLKQDLFSQENLAELGKPFSQILDSMAQLRHTAVHRLRVTTIRVHQYLLDGERLTMLLQDETASRQLALLRQRTELASEDIKTNKNLLETRAAKQIRRYSDRIIELERLQRAAIEDMLKEDRAYQVSAVALLEETISQDPQQALETDRDNDDKFLEGASDAGDSSDAGMGLIGEPRETGRVINVGSS